MAILDRFSLTGKVAIVTGAGQGIGRAIATAFAEAGANVVLAGMNVKDPEASESQLRGVAADLEKLGVTTLPIVVDMRRPQDVQDMVREAIAAFGKIDILVNNVGGTGLTPSIELSEEAWDAGIEENISTTFLGCRYVGAHMAKRRAGAIVNISSMDGRRPALHRAHYGAGKAGVINLTETVAAELGPFGVRVNGIAPTWVMTEWMRSQWDEDPEKERMAVATIPMGRGARPAEIAALAVFLASDASSYVTGETINITGGALVTGKPEMII